MKYTVLHWVGPNTFPVMKNDATYIVQEIAAVFGQILGLSIWKGLLMLKVFQSMVLSLLKGHLPDIGIFLESA